MSNRVTEKQLEAVCQWINQTTGNPETGYVKQADGHYRAQIGNYHISHAYGGVSLHQMQTEGGGVRDVFGNGHMPKRELFDRMHAFLEGLRTAEDIAKSA